MDLSIGSDREWDATFATPNARRSVESVHHDQQFLFN